MPFSTDRLGKIPLLSQGESYPLFHLNDALIKLSAFHFGVIDVLNSPPSTPSEEDSYLIGTSPTGIWSSYANAIALFLNGGWRYYQPSHGWNVFIASTVPDLRYYDANLEAWLSVSSVGGSVNTFSNLGTGAQLIKEITGGSLNVRSLVEGNNISITQNTADIEIAYNPPTHQRVLVNTQTLTGNLTLTNNSANYQYLNPGGADRDVILPVAADGLHFIIKNTAPTNTLFIKESNDDLVQELSTDNFYTQVELVCADSIWHGHAI